MSKRRKLTIGVTGLNNTDNPGPGIPVIRALKEAKSFDARIIGLAYENLEPGIFMHDFVDKVYQLPFPSSGSDAFLERIEYIHSIEKLDVIIPNFDAELTTFMKLEETLRNKNIYTYLPTFHQFEERHKSNLPEYGKKYGLKIPQSVTITTLYELSKIHYDIPYPFYIKGKYYEAYLVNNYEQAKQYFTKLSNKWGFPIIIQQVVKGTEVNVIALGDGEGNTIGAVPMKKLYITDKGKGWSGITLEDEKMMEVTRRILAKTRWRGGMELEMIKTPSDEYYIIEINPRIPAWVYLAIGAGQNLCEALVNLALGNEVKPFEKYQSGKMFVRYSMDMIVDISEYEKLTVTGEL